MKHIVLAFCHDLAKDPVSAHVLAHVLGQRPFAETALRIDDAPVLEYRDDTVRYQLLRLNTVLSHDYDRYAATINQHFGDADVLIVVNWHQGAKAPNAIFTVQTTGDMASGAFSPVDPAICRGLFLAIEKQRQLASLDAFSTWMEATHWSGVLYSEQSGTALQAIMPSVIDLEIGSSDEDWSNPIAAKVLAKAIFELHCPPSPTSLSLLGIGGTHFESGFTQLMRDHGETQGLALSHLLPNHWLVADGYDAPERLSALLACARSIKGGIDAVMFHDNLKGSYKEQVRRLAAELGVPALSHKKFRSPEIARIIDEARTITEPAR